jgi:hypothetical protein
MCRLLCLYEGAQIVDPEQFGCVAVEPTENAVNLIRTFA